MNPVCLCLVRALLMLALRQSYLGPESQEPQGQLLGPGDLSVLGVGSLGDAKYNLCILATE